MEKYTFYLNNKKRGTVSFVDGVATADFLRPADQAHFLSEIAILSPKTIEELVRSGYSYWDIMREDKS
jgi:hypothetical protein